MFSSWSAGSSMPRFPPLHPRVVAQAAARLSRIKHDSIPFRATRPHTVSPCPRRVPWWSAPEPCSWFLAVLC
jgi:hypothetical protein